MVVWWRHRCILAVVLHARTGDRPAAVALFGGTILTHQLHEFLRRFVGMKRVDVGVERLIVARVCRQRIGASTRQRDRPRLADVREENVCDPAVRLAVPVDAVGSAQVYVVAEVVVKIDDVVAGFDNGLLRVEVALNHVQSQQVLPEPVARDHNLC